MDPLTKAALNRPEGSNTGFLPEEFFPGHSAFTKSSQVNIQATYEKLSEQGDYVEDKWQLSEDATLSSEDRWVTLLNEISSVASSRSTEWTGLWRENGWRSHAVTLVEGQRKPDIVLVPKSYQSFKSVPFGAILTYIEIKESLNNDNLQAAALQMHQCAGFVTACRIHRSFFLGAIFLGRSLVLMLFAYGASLYSKPFDIDKEPILFIKIVIVLSSGSHQVLGFNPLMLPDIRGSHRLELGGTLYDVLRRTWVRSISMDGRGTKVPLCRNPRDPTQIFALKDCWLPCDGPNDIINNESLTLRKPKPMTDELRQIFGQPDEHDIFRYCRITRGTEWHYETHLPGIPILKHTEIATFPHGLDGEYQHDTTEAITRRFSKDVDMERRIHIRTLSKTCGVSLPWFPCRRAFVGGMMCVVAGHFNGGLKDLLHSDISDLNIWICVDDPENVNDVITDWPEDPALYPKHAVVLGDWGMAEDRSPDSKVKNNAGGITGTFPFFAAELMLDKVINGDVVHDTCHDLEAIFWVMWITSVNMTGPYNQRRKWVDCSSTSTFPGHVRQPADAIGQNKEVPIWATPGIHPASPQEVHQFKRSIPEHQFFDAMSPYWSEGESDRVFQDGMRKLRRHFAWVRLPDGTYAPPKTITHDIFVGILAEMRGSIPADEDRTTPTQVEEARERYTKMLQEADAELGTAMLEVPSFIRTGKTSTSRRSGPSGITVKKLSSSKRKAMLDVPQSSQEAKRSRAGGQGTGRAEPSGVEANGSKSQSTTPPQSASKGKPKLKEVNQDPPDVNRSRKPRRGRASKGRNSTSRK